MKDLLNSVIRFYRDLYQLEFNTETIWNFYSKEVSHLYYPPSFKFLSQIDYALPVDSGWGEAVAQELELSSSEKKLICGVFFVKGHTQILGRNKKVFAPLFLYDVALQFENEIYTLHLDRESLQINPAIQSYLSAIDPPSAIPNDYLIENLILEDNPFSFDGLVKMAGELKKLFPPLNLEKLDQRLASDQIIFDLEKWYRSRKETLNEVLIPEMAIGMVEKPKKSKGVINELTELSTIPHANNSLLHTLFGFSNKNSTTNPLPSKSTSEIIVPASLSQPQQKIMEATKQGSLTLVVGPPGTGKSFSIAAIAIQAAHEGKKVLVASKNEQACQVIQQKITQDIGIKNISLDASKPRYRISVAAKLRNIANGIEIRQLNQSRYQKLLHEVKALKTTIKKITADIIKREREEVKWGRKLSNEKRGILQSVEKWLIRYRHRNKPRLWHLKHELSRNEQLLQKKEKRLIVQTYQNQLFQLLNNGNRSDLLTLEKVFKTHQGNLIKEIFSEVNFDVILKALPIWICKSSEIANILPLQENLVDLLIIDEASQCDIASSIPLLYRTKAAVIVGDPNQLRHISFISKNQEQTTRQKYGLTHIDVRFRNFSVLDLSNTQINSQRQVIFLNEHFRSMPDIIDFSNQHFYAGKLKVMTSNPTTDHLKHLTIHHLPGNRNAKGENEKEAEAILSAIKNRVAQEQDLDKATSSSIGILSPFRAQVEFMRKKIKTSLDLKTIKKHKLLIGTPFDFQGAERDLVFLTFGVDQDTHHSVFRYLNRPDLFNVSITRARRNQDVFVSVKAEQIPSNTILYQYLTHEFKPQITSENTTIFDNFLKEVISYLKKIKAGVPHVDKFIAGSKLDIVLVQKNRVIGIDLIGFPGQFQDQISLESLKSLERSTIKVFLLPFSSWYLDRNQCRKALKKFLFS